MKPGRAGLPLVVPPPNPGSTGGGAAMLTVKVAGALPASALPAASVTSVSRTETVYVPLSAESQTPSGAAST